MNEPSLEKKDRRVVKTRRAIRNAFIKLISEKEINEISIKSIADEANIDRKTFYNHYTGVDEIRDDLENELIALLDIAVNELDFEKNIKNPSHVFEILNEILNGNLDLYEHLMKLDARSDIVRKINDFLKIKIRDGIIKSRAIAESENVDMCAQFVTAGLISVYQNWFNSDRSVPLEEVSKNAGRLVLYGLKDFTVVS